MDLLYESQKIVKTNIKENFYIKSTLDVYNLPQVQAIKDKAQEHFIAIALNTKNRVLSVELVGIGSTSSVPMDVSDVVRCAIIRGANKLIIAHNHPSGDTEPSKQDILFTKRLNTVASLLNITLLDHLVIGDRTFCSMKEKDIMYSELNLLEYTKTIKELTKTNMKLNEQVEKLQNKETNKKGIKQKIEVVKKQQEENKSKDKNTHIETKKQISI